MESLVIYSTKRKFNDSSADDMKYGDLSDSYLQNHLNLHDVSPIVNPYTLQLLSPFTILKAVFIPQLQERKSIKKIV